MPDGAFWMVAAVTLAAAACWAGWRELRHPLAGRRVLVPLVEPRDHSLRGRLVRTRASWVVLREVSLVKPDRSEAAMLGEVVIDPASAVLFQLDER